MFIIGLLISIGSALVYLFCRVIAQGENRKEVIEFLTENKKRIIFIKPNQFIESKDDCKIRILLPEDLALHNSIYKKCLLYAKVKELPAKIWINGEGDVEGCTIICDE